MTYFYNSRVRFFLNLASYIRICLKAILAGKPCNGVVGELSLARLIGRDAFMVHSRSVDEQRRLALSEVEISAKIRFEDFANLLPQALLTQPARCGGERF